MANSTKAKAKKPVAKSDSKVTLESKAPKKVSKVVTRSKAVSKPAKIDNSKAKANLAAAEAIKKVAEKKIESVSNTKPAEVKATSTVKTKKKSFLEPGFRSVSLIAISVVILFAAVILIWEFALPSRYKLSTVVADSNVERIFLRADKLKADDAHDVAVIKPCNLAVRFDKNKYNAAISVSKNGNFGVYKDPFGRIFDNKDIDVYEFSLSEKNSKKPKAAVLACLDAGLKRNLTADNLKDITDTISNKIPGSFNKVANDLKEIPFFNETSQKYFGKNLFQKIRLVSEQTPDIDISNTFFAFDNRLLFVAAQNSPDDIEAQVDSLNPSDSSFDVQTTINTYKDADKALTDKINQENSALKFDQNKDWVAAIDVANFGTIKVQLSDKYAPRTVENFLRLSYRGYYDDTIFHRIVKRSGFNVIQGGDKEKKDGTGGQSAFYISKNSPGNIPDEIWSVAPEFSTGTDGKNTPTNTPEFRSPDLYKDYDNKTGLVTFPKGSIAMATTGQADSASSQFFIVLSDTQLPAEYTIFGKVKDESIDVLDKILKEVSPATDAKAGPESGQDGIPNKELKINSVKIVEPQI